MNEMNIDDVKFIRNLRVKVTVSTEDGEVLEQFKAVSLNANDTPGSMSRYIRDLVEDGLDTEDM